MALTTPDSASDIITRATNDVFLSLEAFGAKPSLKNSWLNALIVAYSNRVFDFYFALDQAALESLPDTATSEDVGGSLERWSAIFGIRRKVGIVSDGSVIATGTATSAIGAETILVLGDGTEYRVTTATTITTKSLSVSGITRSGTTATLTTDAPHDFASNVKISVTGADQSEYNVTDFTAVVTGISTLTYVVSGSPATPATGTILLGGDTATLEVESTVFAEDSDIAGLQALQFESPLVGVDEAAQTGFSGLVGGVDQETTDALRARMLSRIQNPVAHFNAADIESEALTVAGVTRVFVFEITPSVGQVTVYFMRDDDPISAIPSGAEVNAVKAVLDEIRPANTAPVDLIVLAPTPVPTNFDFASLLPSTSTMKTSVRASLAQFFDERTTLGVSVTEDEYRSAIFNTVDTETGQSVESFSLNSPVGSILITTGEIATLGTFAGEI